MKKVKISIIAGIGENRELGKDNKLLWHIPEDLKRFKKLTTGHVVIMGRKTFESIGKPLPKRINIIVTRNKKFSEYISINLSTTSASLSINSLKTGRLIDTFVVDSLEKAINLAKEKESHFVKTSRDREIFIIGGGQIYQQVIKYADKLYLTIVKGKYQADIFFPDYSMFKKVVAKKDSRDDNYQYTFWEFAR